MTYINVSRVPEADAGVAAMRSADSSYETSSEGLQMASELLNAVDMLDEGEVLVIWKVIL